MNGRTFSRRPRKRITMTKHYFRCGLQTVIYPDSKSVGDHKLHPLAIQVVCIGEGLRSGEIFAACFTALLEA